MQIKAGDHQTEFAIPDQMPRFVVYVNGFPLPVRPISPNDGEELRKKDATMNGSRMHTRGIPSFWWRVSPDKIEFWPAASNNMTMENLHESGPVENITTAHAETD